MKPRIAHVINSFGLGGVPQVAYQLLRSLPSDKYELFLYVLKSYQDNPAAREQLHDDFINVGVTVRSPKRDKKKFHVVGEMLHWLLDDDVDLLHTHSYKPNIYGRLAGLLGHHKGIKMIAHYHNYYEDKWLKDDSLIYEQLLAKNTDHFFACSSSVANHVANNIGINLSQIEILLNGIDINRFKTKHDTTAIKAEFGIPETSKLVGVVGRISKQKAQDIFLEAAAKLSQIYPNILFLLAGAPDEAQLLEQLKAQAEALGIKDKIRFLGYVTDIPKIYSILDVLVMPSRWEGFGLALVEAMAMGVPIVASEVGGIPEVVVPDKTALLVPPENPELLANAIVKLLANPILCASMAEAGRLRAEQFSCQSIGLQVDLLYQILLTQQQVMALCK